jgi:trimethylamine--corrinoid protein Co-methyltransferase
MTVRMRWLSETQRDAIVSEALGVLERVGMRLSGSQNLDALDAAGALVDHSAGVVRFPPELVMAAVERCPREALMAGARAEKDVLLDGTRTYFNVSGCGAKTLDRETGLVRPSTLADVRDGTVVLDATPQLDVVWTFVTANDVPLERRELLEYYTYLSETEKPVVFVDCPTETAAVRRIFEVLGGTLEDFRARPRVSVLCSVRSPLEINGPLFDVTASLAVLGAPVWVYAMPIAGATSPITLAGTLVVAWAEILGTATAIQALAPGAAVVVCAGGGILDMKAATMSLGSLEHSLMGAASIEIGHHLELPMHSSGLSTDAKHAGPQLGYEKGLKVLTAVATGADIVSGGFGFLDSSSVFSLPLIPIDAEIAAMAKRMAAGIEVTPETLMGDAIARVGIGGDYLHERDTRTRVRAGEHFVPWIGSRLPMRQWMADGKTELQAAEEKIEEALAARRERGPYLSADQRAELAAICGVEDGELR